MTVALTRRQREILDLFRAYVQQHSISPTLEEIAQQLGVNKVTVFGHVAELERKGMLIRSKRGISRGMQLPEESSGNARIPILGAIAAGRPIAAVEEGDSLDLGEWISQGKDVYALRVQGNSMIEDAIMDGDVVVVERRHTAVDGETVVAVLPGEEVTLKRIYRENGHIRLQPANAALSPTFVPEVEIRGVVVAVLRRV